MLPLPRDVLCVAALILAGGRAVCIGVHSVLVRTGPSGKLRANVLCSKHLVSPRSVPQRDQGSGSVGLQSGGLGGWSDVAHAGAAGLNAPIAEDDGGLGVY